MSKDKKSIRLERKQWKDISYFAIANNSEFIRQAIERHLNFYRDIEFMCTLFNSHHRKEEFIDNINRLAHTTLFSTSYWIKTCIECLNANQPLPWEERK